MKNRKLLRAMSLIFALLLVASSAVVVVPFSASAATTTDAWAADNNGVFTIDSVDDLYAFASTAEANGWYAGKTVKLAIDIDLDGEPAWTPIAQFKGTFDGNGKTIKNMVLTGTGSIGMFMVLNGATVKNFRLEASLTKTGSANVPTGILAVSTEGDAVTIDTVYVGGTLSADKDAGFRNAGFVGYVTTTTTIKNSVSGVHILQGFKANAGFVGATKMNTSLTLTDCAFVGYIDPGTNVETGAFVGRIGGNVTMTRCLKLGFADDQTGQYAGVFGYCDNQDFALGNNPAGFTAPTITLEDCYTTMAAEKVIVIGGHGGRSTNQYNIVVKYGGETVYTYAVAEGNKEMLHATASAAVKTLAVADTATLTKDNFATTCPGFTNWTVTTDTVAYQTGDTAKTVPVVIPTGVANIKPGTFVKGETTFKVGTADELIAVAAKIASKNNFKGKSIELTADIDMTGKTWTMVDKFSGTLDGNGFAIKGIKIESATDHVAMFKTLDGAVIKNLTLEGEVTVTATSGDGVVALLAQYASGDDVTIENVYVGGTITAPTHNKSYRVAGIIAYVTNTTTIKNTVSAVNIAKAYKTNAGFVAATKYGSTLNLIDCAFTGKLDASLNVETGAFIGRVGGDVNMTRCVKLGFADDGTSQWSGAMMYFDNKDFDTSATPANYVAPTIVIEDSFTTLGAAGDKILGGHGTRSAGQYNIVVKYNGETAYSYVAADNVPATGATSADIAKVDVYTLVNPHIKTVAAGDTVSYTKDNFSEVLITLAKVDWVMTDKNVVYGTADTKVVGEIMPETVANMLKRTVVAQYTVVATPDWKADANGVFNIATPGDLLAFAANAEANGWYNGKAVQLTADIDMKKVDFVPVAKFMGYFEGNGYAIKNLVVNQKVEPLGGLINVGDGMTMKNVRFLGCSVTMPEVPEGGTGSMVGGIVGNTAGNFDCTFENIYIDSTLSAPNVNTAYRVGGLIGNVSANPIESEEELPPAKVTIKNCVSAITVASSYKAAAGFVGSNAFGTLVEITDCAFIGRFVKTNAENAGFIGRVVGSVNLTRCINLTGISQWNSQWSGSFVYLDNNDFLIGNTFAIASMIPSEVNLVDCYSVAPTDALSYLVGAHGSRNAYKLTISYTGDTAPVFTNEKVESFKVDYEAASKTIKTVGVGETVTLKKDNLATVCPTFTNWKATDETVSYGTNMNIVKVLPNSVASMFDGTFVKGTIPTDIPVWKLPEPPVDPPVTPGPGDEEETTTAPSDETTAAPGDETTKAEEETTGKDDDEKKGCGSVVGGSIAVIIALAGGAMFLTRKKED